MKPGFRDSSLLLSLALLAIGLLIRIALYFPFSMYQIDSDAVIAGLCAFRVADGHYPIFLPGGNRVGGASCYLAAVYFHLFGTGRAGLALTGLTWGALYLIFTLLFLWTTFGRKIAPLAFLFAIVPSEQFMTVTYAPWGYGEIMASSAATLWLASAWRNGGKTWQRLGFGFSVGLGIWFSIQTLMIALPAIAWIALKRRKAFAKESLVAVPAAIAGAIPFLIGNVAGGFPSLTANWYSRPVSSLPQAWDNFVWLLTNLLPKLLFRSSGWWSETTILIVAYALVAVGFVAALRRDARDSGRLYGSSEVGPLLALVLATCVLIFSFSAAGAIRGWTVRYIAPLYVIVPVFCGVGVEALWRWSRWLAAATVAALLIPNLLTYGLPGNALRADLTTALTNDERLRTLLAQRHVRMVYGDYLWVYHLNFDSRERVAGVPTVAAYDYYDYGGRLGTSQVRWALLGGLDEVSGWVRGVGALGTMTKSGDLRVFIADRPAPDAARLLAALRAPHTYSP